MSSQWKTESVGALCDVLDSRRKPITKRYRVAGPYPYYGATGVLDHVEGYLFDEPLVLVGEDGAKWASGDATAFSIEGRAWVNNHAHVLRPYRDSVIDAWLIYYLTHLDLSPYITGLTVPKLNQGSLVQVPVPVPPLAEQQRIVGILDEAFEGIAAAKANADRNIRNSRAIFDSHLQEVFARSRAVWPFRQFGQLAEQITDGTHNSPPYVAAGIPMLDSKHVRDDFSIDDSQPAKFIAPATDAVLAKRCKPRAGDLLVSSRGSIGKIAVVRSGQDFNIMGNMILIRLPEHISRTFVAFYLQSQLGYLESIARGAAQKGLYLGQVREFELPVPSEADQRRTGDQLSALAAESQSFAAVCKRKLAALDALKQSLLHHAFTGQL